MRGSSRSLNQNVYILQPVALAKDTLTDERTYCDEL